MIKVGPWLSFTRMKELSATNTLYVARFKTQLSLRDKYIHALQLLSSPGRDALWKHARVYADGLIKFEPNDIAATALPIVEPREDVFGTYRDAVKALSQGNTKEGAAIAVSALGI